MPKTLIRNQVINGTPQTTSTTGLANTTFGEPTNQIRVTITPERTGRFRVYGDVYIRLTNNASRIESRINVISGAGSTIEQILQGSTFGDSAVVTEENLHMDTVLKLVAGTTYILGVETRNLSGAGVYDVLSGGTAYGNALSVEEL